MLLELIKNHPPLLCIILVAFIGCLILLVSTLASFSVKQQEKLWVPFGLHYLRFLAIHTLILQWISWYWLLSHKGIQHGIELHLLHEKLYIIVLVASAYDLVFSTLILRVIYVHREILKYRKSVNNDKANT